MGILLGLAGVVLSLIPVVWSGPEIRTSSEENHSLQKSHFWIRRSLSLARSISCSSMDWGSRSQCREMKRRPTSQFTVYTAEPSRRGHKVFMTLPDGTLDHSGDHDGVVLIDPFPFASFGHLVFLFVVDDESDGNACKLSNGNYSGANQICFHHVKRDGCHADFHSVRRRHWRTHTRPCQINFLPSVFEASNSIRSNFSQAGKQLLKCRNLPGLAPCPALRSLIPTKRTLCHSPFCLKKLKSQLEVGCRLFEICDHAVVIQGGWNHLVSRRDHFHLLRQTEAFFLRNGFSRSNIKLFYSNGVPDYSVRGSGGRIYPASKSLMRDYIRALCSESCVETLAIVLRGPVLGKEAILLWDSNENQKAEDEELYSMEEVMEDLWECRARQIIFVEDHSYGGFLRSRLQWNPRLKESYKNLQIFSSTNAVEFERNGEFLRYFMRKNHRKKCTAQIYRETVKAGIISGDHSHHPDPGRTIFGAPCGVLPPFSQQELEEKFFGCQNVPTLQWFQHATRKTTKQDLSNEHNFIVPRHPLEK